MLAPSGRDAVLATQMLEQARMELINVSLSAAQALAKAETKVAELEKEASTDALSNPSTPPPKPSDTVHDDILSVTELPMVVCVDSDELLRDEAGQAAVQQALEAVANH